MSQVKTEEDVGDTLRFQETITRLEPFEEEEELFDPDIIEITIENEYTGEKVVEDEELIRHDEGKYFFNWDTRNVKKGDYRVRIKAEMSNSKEVTTYYIRLK